MGEEPSRSQLFKAMRHSEKKKSWINEKAETVYVSFMNS